MRSLLLSILLFLALALPAGVGAEHMTTACEPTASVPELAAGGHAVFVDEVLGSIAVYSIWIYEEANGLDGIQRVDEYTVAAGISDETCGHGGDDIIF